MEKRKVCQACHISYDSRLDVCPSCKGKLEEKLFEEPKEGEGRAHRLGGELCDYCPRCVGRADWCPWSEDD